MFNAISNKLIKCSPKYNKKKQITLLEKSDVWETYILLTVGIIFKKKIFIIIII